MRNKLVNGVEEMFKDWHEYQSKFKIVHRRLRGIPVPFEVIKIEKYTKR